MTVSDSGLDAVSEGCIIVPVVALAWPTVLSSSPLSLILSSIESSGEVNGEDGC